MDTVDVMVQALVVGPGGRQCHPDVAVVVVVRVIVVRSGLGLPTDTSPVAPTLSLLEMPGTACLTPTNKATVDVMVQVLGERAGGGKGVVWVVIRGGSGGGYRGGRGVRGWGVATGTPAVTSSLFSFVDSTTCACLSSLTRTQRMSWCRCWASGWWWRGVGVGGADSATGCHNDGGGSGVSVFVGRRRGGLATGTPFVMSTLSLLVIVEQCSVLEFTNKGIVDVLV